MAKFLLCVWPFTGHIYPNIAVACSLRTRGHDVAFYTGDMARHVIEKENFICFPFDQLAQRISSIVGTLKGNEKKRADSLGLYECLRRHYSPSNDQGTFARIGKSEVMFRDWLLGTLPQQVMDILTIQAEWKPDVIVCDPFMWGPILILQETHHIPVAVFSYFAACLLSRPDAPPFGLGLPPPRNWSTRLIARLASKAKNIFNMNIRRDAERLRQFYGLSPLSTSIIDFAVRMPLYIVASVPEFDYCWENFPSSVHYVGPCLWDKVSNRTVPGWISWLSRDLPTIYVTEGTANVRAPVLLRTAYKALANMPVQVIMTTGRRKDFRELKLEFSAPNIRIEEWVSHSELFPKIDVAILHGGSGTVLSALKEKLPMIVVPMWWDQMENARRIEYIGAGLCLPLSRLTSERLRAAVKRILEDSAFRQKASWLSRIFATYGGEVSAARLLENLSSEENIG